MAFSVAHAVLPLVLHEAQNAIFRFGLHHSGVGASFTARWPSWIESSGHQKRLWYGKSR
jgi:hypothetical protein